MPAQSIPPQDPSMSPTYAHSTNQAQPSIPPSIRRNLFASHLSRRAVPQASQNPFGPPSPERQYDQSQTDLYAGPTLQPTKRSMAFQDFYDPNVSPSNNPISPSTSTSMFSRESIIAVHPVTGKPLLPTFPTLPPKLRLSEDDQEREDSDMETSGNQQIEYHNQHDFAHSPTYHNNISLSSELGYDLEMDSSELIRSHNPHSHLGLDNVVDTNSEESHTDRERIERLLADMQARQRARARTIAPVSPMDATSANATTMMGSSSANVGRARRNPTGYAKGSRMLNAPSSSDNPHPSSSHNDLSIGGVGAVMDPAEKEELMGLIMTSLRRKLAVAEEENWMYGGVDATNGAGAYGLESELGTGYD